MAKGKSLFSVFICTECKKTSRVVAHNAQGGPPERQSRNCRKCRKHTKHRVKVLKKPAKK